MMITVQCCGGQRRLRTFGLGRLSWSFIVVGTEPRLGSEGHPKSKALSWRVVVLMVAEVWVVRAVVWL